MMNTGLLGRTALITGASGGIGWSIAKALAAEGVRVVLHAHTQGDALRRRIEPAEMPNALVVEADVRRASHVDAMMDRAASWSGGVDICVANAGISPPEPRRLHEMDITRVEDVIATNLLGVLWTARAFMRQVASTGRAGSSLILIGSTAGRFGEAGHAEYATSKAALVGLMLSYKNEIVTLDPAGRCNLVEPGWTYTPMAAAALEDGLDISRALGTMPLKRLALPEDVASAVAFLASPLLSRHITGQTVTVAGGMEGRVLWSPGEIDMDGVRSPDRSS